MAVDKTLITGARQAVKKPSKGLGSYGFGNFVKETGKSIDKIMSPYSDAASKIIEAGGELGEKDTDTITAGLKGQRLKYLFASKDKKAAMRAKLNQGTEKLNAYKQNREILADIENGSIDVDEHFKKTELPFLQEAMLDGNLILNEDGEYGFLRGNADYDEDTEIQNLADLSTQYTQSQMLLDTPEDQRIMNGGQDTATILAQQEELKKQLDDQQKVVDNDGKSFYSTSQLTKSLNDSVIDEDAFKAMNDAMEREFTIGTTADGVKVNKEHQSESFEHNLRTNILPAKKLSFWARNPYQGRVFEEDTVNELTGATLESLGLTTSELKMWAELNNVPGVDDDGFLDDREMELVRNQYIEEKHPGLGGEIFNQAIIDGQIDRQEAEQIVSQMIENPSFEANLEKALIDYFGSMGKNSFNRGQGYIPEPIIEGDGDGDNDGPVIVE